MKTLLWLNLNSGIWAHNMQEIALISALDPDRFRVIILTCGGLQTNGCHVRESKSRRLEESWTRNFDCRNCNSGVMTGKKRLESLGFHVEVVNLTDWQDPRSFEEPDDWPSEHAEEFPDSEFLVDGISLRGLAFYEWYLNSKSKSLNSKHLTAEQKRRRFHSLKNSALVLRAFSNWLSQRTASIDFAVSYAPQYSINNVVMKKLELDQPDCVQYFVEGSDNPAHQYSRVRIWNWRKYGLAPPEYSSGESREGLQVGSSSPIWNSPEAKDNADLFLSHLSRASTFMVYSKRDTSASRSEILEQAGLQDQVQVGLLALSSLDEMHAAAEIGALSSDFYPGKVYRSQFDMVAEILDYFSERPNMGLILRLHPREFPDGRNSSRSDTQAIWSDLLEGSPPNVYLNTPNDPWSLGDLISATDFMVTGWSSSALQAIMMRKEVVTYDQNMGFWPNTIVSSGISKSAFRSNLASRVSPGELEKRRSILISYLWWRHQNLEVPAPSTFRLTKSRIAEIPILRKTIYGLEELLPATFRRFDLFFSTQLDEPARARVRMLFDKASNYPTA